MSPDQPANTASSPAAKRGWRARVQALRASLRPLVQRAAPLVAILVAIIKRVQPAVDRATDWAATHRLMAVLIGSAGTITLITSMVLLIAAMQPPLPPPPPVTVERALMAYDRGDYAATTRMANQLAREELEEEDLFGPSYLFGRLLHDKAELLSGHRRKRYHALAARYLEESRVLGWPEERQVRGQLLLGHSLLESQQILDARSVLRAVIDDTPHVPPEAYRWLAQAYAAPPQADLPQALEANARFLASKDLPATDLMPATLQQARWQLRVGQIEACRATLDQIPADSSWVGEAMLVRGESLLAEAIARRQAAPANEPANVAPLLQEALQLLSAAPSKDRFNRQLAISAQLATGRCQVQLGDEPAAIKTFETLTSRHHDSAEGWAADIERADLLRRAGRDGEAAAGFRHAFALYRWSRQIDQVWSSEDELRRRLGVAYDDMLRNKHFAAALDLAESVTPVLTAERSTQLLAQTHVAWARALEVEAAQAKTADAETLLAQAQEHFRSAATLHQQLAEMRFATREYADHLWEAAQNLLAAQEYDAAIKQLEAYLALDSRQRRNQALTLLGEALLALGRAPEAVTVLKQCLDLSGEEIVSFQCRVLLAEAHLQRGELAEAEELLTANLNDDLLTPASKEWRESLWALSRLLFASGRYDAAIPKLEEACARFPQARTTIEMQYLLAESYFRAAVIAQREAETTPIAQERIDATARATRQWQASLPHYDRVIMTLEELSMGPNVSAVDRSTLRNALFGRAATLYRIGRHDDALAIYLDLAGRYQDEPITLDAYVQVAACYRKLARLDEARAALLQAKTVLGQLRPDTAFTATTNFNRQQWGDLLDALSTL